MDKTITPEHQLPAGTILNGRYEIVRTLGEGGFGITYMGHNIVLDIPVAIKEYYPHGYANRSASHDLMVTITDTTKNAYFSTWKDKFLEEAKTLSKFEKIPNIVNVLDFFEQNGTAYIVMEYLSGVTLSNFVKLNGPFKANDLCAIMIPLLRSLDKIHQEKLIHRDISPDNIMVMEDGSLKLYDFGAAREYSEESQKSLSIMLKPGYAPEEQYRSRGNQGPWTDVYAACATMYYCITGTRPIESVQRVFLDELAPPLALGVPISPQIDKAIMIGLSVKAENRFQSAAALATALERSLVLSQSQPVTRAPAPVSVPATASTPRKKKHRKKLRSTKSVVSLVLKIVFAIVAIAIIAFPGVASMILGEDVTKINDEGTIPADNKANYAKFDSSVPSAGKMSFHRFIETSDSLYYDGITVEKYTVSDDVYDAIRYGFQTQETLNVYILDFNQLIDYGADFKYNSNSTSDVIKTYGKMVPYINNCLTDLNELKSYYCVNSYSDAYYNEVQQYVKTNEDYLKTLRKFTGVESTRQVHALEEERDKFEKKLPNADDSLVEIKDAFWNVINMQLE